MGLAVLIWRTAKRSSCCKIRNCKLSLSSRYPNTLIGKKFDSEIKTIAKKKGDSKLDIHIAKEVTRDPVEKTKNIEQFFEEIKKLAKSAEIKIQSEHRYATSSLCDVLSGKHMIGSLGPIGNDVRTPNEHIFRDSLIDRGVLLALTINKCHKLSNEVASNGS